MVTEALTVTSWHGVDVRARHTLGTDRRPLDTPKVLNNMRVDENGHLHYPPAPTITVPFSAPVFTMRYVDSPRCLLVQLRNGQVWSLPLEGGNVWEPATPTLLVTLASNQWPIWSASGAGTAYFGYAGRGDSTAGQVFRMTSRTSATNITSSEPMGGAISYCEFYKGRRFVVGRGREVMFSELNDFETFEEDSVFTPGGDDRGTGYVTTPGVVQGMAAWEDVLLIFMESSVWILTGSSPENFQLRQAQTNVGNSQPFALTRVDEGVLSYGGRNLRDYGVFLFGGSSARRVSAQIDPLLRTQEGLRLFATQSHGQYVLCRPDPNPVNPQVFLYDLQRENWSTFNGWSYAHAELTNVGLWLAQANSILLWDGETFPRADDWGGRVVLGYEDEGNATGHTRFLAVKLSGRSTGGQDASTVTVHARVPGTPGEVVRGPYVLTEDTFDGVVVPIGLRGHALEIDLRFLPAFESPHASVTIEQLQLVQSRKGEKVSRG